MAITLRDTNGSCVVNSSGCGTFSSTFTVWFGKGSMDLLLLKSEIKFCFLSEVSREPAGWRGYCNPLGVFPQRGRDMAVHTACPCSAVHCIHLVNFRKLISSDVF